MPKKAAFRLFRRRLTAGGLAVLLLLGLCSCSSGEATQTVSLQAPGAVQVEEVQLHELSLSWEGAAQAENYQVDLFTASQNGEEIAATQTTGETRITLEGLAANTQFQVEVTALLEVEGKTWASAPSQRVTVQTLSPQVGEVTGLTVEPAGSSTLLLYWDPWETDQTNADGSPAEVRYRVYAAEDAQQQPVLLAEDLTDAAYSETDLAPSSARCYWVSAQITMDGVSYEGAMCQPVSGVTDPEMEPVAQTQTTGAVSAAQPVSSSSSGSTGSHSGASSGFALSVPYRSQKGVLPTGCEAASASMVLLYYGIQAEPTTVADQLPKGNLWQQNGMLYGPNPNECFVGNPYTSSGYGCYAPVIASTLRSHYSQINVQEVYGSSLEQLYQNYVQKGIPVIFWATINLRPTRAGTTWHLESGGTYTWKANEHCMVLIGKQGTRYICQDPYNGNGTVYLSASTLAQRYQEQGSQAVVVTLKQSEPAPEPEEPSTVPDEPAVDPTPEEPVQPEEPSEEPDPAPEEPGQEPEDPDSGTVSTPQSGEDALVIPLSP